MAGRRLLGAASCCLLPAAIALWWLEQSLLARAVLDTRDLAPIVGAETGTLRDHLLNVWTWDAAVFVLFLASVPGMFLGIRLLSSRPHGTASPGTR